MSVRYLDFSITCDVSRFEERLLQCGQALEVPVGRFLLQLTTAQAAVDLGIASMNEDRYFFLKEPPRFRPGEIPMDGSTGPMQVVYDAPRQRCEKAE
jgi:hypothetical protein